MNEVEARHVLLVRAVETAEAGDPVFTAEERREFAERALEQLRSRKPRPGQKEDERFIARRAELAWERLVARHPEFISVLRSACWPRWLSFLLPALAFVAGAAANELVAGKRINIIGFPMLAMLAWNLIAYLLFITAPLSKMRAVPHPLTRFFLWLAQPASRRAGTQTTLSRAAALFLRDWMHFSGRLNAARVRRILHASAAALAAGMVTGLYVRALGLEYLAGWESTFIDAPALHRLLQFTLGPASALTGIALPDPAHLAALRWSASQPGENAASWIHLQATTIALFVILPRLLLLAWEALRVGRLQRAFPLPVGTDPYYRRFSLALHGKTTPIRIFPYRYRLSPMLEQSLRHLFMQAMGGAAEVEIEPAIGYGEEAAFVEQFPGAGEQDPVAVALLFNLSATPESENQGLLIEGIHDRLQKSPVALLVLLDESGFAAKMRGYAEAEKRLDERRRAWLELLQPQEIKPVFIDLEVPDKAEGMMQLSAALTGRDVEWR